MSLRKLEGIARCDAAHPSGAWALISAPLSIRKVSEYRESVCRVALARSFGWTRDVREQRDHFNPSTTACRVKGHCIVVILSTRVSPMIKQ